jgi:hypothetical protein
MPFFPTKFQTWSILSSSIRKMPFFPFSREMNGISHLATIFPTFIHNPPRVHFIFGRLQLYFFKKGQNIGLLIETMHINLFFFTKSQKSTKLRSHKAATWIIQRNKECREVICILYPLSHQASASTIHMSRSFSEIRYDHMLIQYVGLWIACKNWADPALLKLHHFENFTLPKVKHKIQRKFDL